MLRVVFYAVVLILFARAVSRIWAGFLEGLYGGPARSSVPQRGVQMVRDPVCGTFVMPDRALTLSVGRQQLYFCSSACRDKYRAA
jgi:YHS domain-containing protein